MDKDTLIGGIFMVIIVGIFIGAIVYEEHRQLECTTKALEHNLSVNDTILLCGLR